MDIIDDIIGLFYEYGLARFVGNGECEIYIDDEIELRRRLEKLLTER